MSEAEESAVKAKLKIATDFDASPDTEKRFNYVPWTGSEHVTQAELATWIPRYMSYLSESSNGTIREAIFIDSKSAVDKKVSKAVCDREPFELDKYREDEIKVMKICWSRVPAQDAQSDYTKLGMGSVSCEEMWRDDEEVSTTQEERIELAQLGKPFAEAGIWDEAQPYRLAKDEVGRIQPILWHEGMQSALPHSTRRFPWQGSKRRENTLNSSTFSCFVPWSE